MFGKRKEVPAGSEDRDEAVLQSLKGVGDGGGGDLVAAGRVRDIAVDGSTVGFSLVFPTPLFPSTRATEDQAVEAVKRLPWVNSVKVALRSEIPEAPRAINPGILTGVKNVVAVASGKGGVGKSTIAVNLAVALADAGARTGLLDADIYGPSIPMMLATRVEPTLVEKDGRKVIKAVESQGLKIMSMGFLVEEERPMIWRGPMVHGAVQQFLRDVDWGELDYLVVDLPPGTGDVQLTMVQQVPLAGAVIVTTPQDVAMLDARKAFNMFRETKVEILGIVENMSVFLCPHCNHPSHIFGEAGARRWAERASVRLLGEIPLEPSIREGGDEGRPAVRHAPGSPTSRAFLALAEAVARALAESAAKGPPAGQKLLKFSV